MSDQPPRGYRPLAPRTRLLGGSGGDGGEGAGSPAGGAPDEKRMRRASTACTECQKRRTRVQHSLRFLFFPIFPYLSPLFHLIYTSINLTCSSFFYCVSVPALLIVPNAQPTTANVSSMKPPTDAAKLQPRESRTNWTISGHLWTISSGSSEIVMARRCN